MTCRDNGHTCVYTESEKRVTVPERYLLELQAQARKANSLNQDGDDASETAEVASQDIELGFTGVDNWVLSGSGQYRMSISGKANALKLTRLTA